LSAPSLVCCPRLLRIPALEAAPRGDGVAFAKDCPTPDSRNAFVLGCYQPDRRRIFILRVDRPDLAATMTVTAAYEMLHAAYADLDTTARKRRTSTA